MHIVENKKFHKRKKELKTNMCVYERNVQYNLIIAIYILICLLYFHFPPWFIKCAYPNTLFYFINMKVNLSTAERNCSFEHGIGSSQLEVAVKKQWASLATEVAQVSEQM